MAAPSPGRRARSSAPNAAWGIGGDAVPVLHKEQLRFDYVAMEQQSYR
jgi:hypothetical protein